MKTEIGGTFKWSKKQIVAYAGAFNEGDAINVDGVGWVEVTSRNDAHGDFLEAGELKGFKLSMGNVGVHNGFISPKGRYLVTTPKDYEVQEGDKLVWLGETQEYYGRSELTFGKVYDVRKDGDRLIYKTDDTLSILARSEKNRWKFWGVIPRYENVKQKKDMSGKSERSGNAGKFKKGDRVRVTGGNHEGWEGSVGQSDEVGGELSCAALFDDGRGYRWVEEELLELVEKVEKSPEQEAFEYLLSQDRDATRSILQGEISIWANVHLEHRDYDDLRQATEILEKLEKGE